MNYSLVRYIEQEVDRSNSYNCQHTDFSRTRKTTMTLPKDYTSYTISSRNNNMYIVNE